MEKKLLIDENLTVSYFPEEKMLLQVWVGFSGSKKYRELVDGIEGCFDNYDINCCISDLREAKVISPEESNYAVQSINKCAEKGLKRMALIVPKSVITQMTLKKVVGSVGEQNGALETQYFDSVSSAREWLHS